MLYADVQRAVVLAGDMVGDDANENIQHVEAVGMSATANDGEDVSFRLRVTFR